MNRQMSASWRKIAVAGLLGVSGILATSGCMFKRGAGQKSVSQTPPIRQEESASLTPRRPAVVHASQADFEEQVLRSDVPVLVDFYADWCGPCKRLSPVLEELAAETPDAKIVKVNVEQSRQLAAEYGVQSIPSLKVFKNGKVVDQAAGVASKEQLRQMLRR